jgi:hypothetical protein
MNLLDLMGVEYRRSRWSLYGSLSCGVAVYGCVLYDALSEHSVSGRLAIAGLILQIAILLLKQRSSTHYCRAEEIRRLAVLKDGLGLEPPKLTIANIVARIGNATPSNKVYVGKYFASDKPAGIARLLENIEESAFWTHRIALVTGNLGFIAVLVGIGVSLLALLTFINGRPSPNALHTAAEAAVVTLGFVVAGDFLVLSMEYRDLSGKACHRMGEADGQLKSGTADRDAAILLFGEYNCNLSGAPPLPRFIYRLLHKRLSNAWMAREAKIPVQP